MNKDQYRIGFSVVEWGKPQAEGASVTVCGPPSKVKAALKRRHKALNRTSQTNRHHFTRTRRLMVSCHFCPSPPPKKKGRLFESALYIIEQLS